MTLIIPMHSHSQDTFQFPSGSFFSMAYCNWVASFNHREFPPYQLVLDKHRSVLTSFLSSRLLSLQCKASSSFDSLDSIQVLFEASKPVENARPSCKLISHRVASKLHKEASHLSDSLHPTVRLTSYCEAYFSIYRKLTSQWET